MAAGKVAECEARLTEIRYQIRREEQVSCGLKPVRMRSLAWREEQTLRALEKAKVKPVICR